MRFLACALLLAVPPFAAAQPKSDDPLSAPRKQLQRGNAAEARAAFEKAAADPKFAPAAAVGIAACWRAEGEYARALTTLGDALKHHPDHPDLLANRADLLFFLGNWDDATKDADAAIAKQDKQFLARWVRARILRDKGDLPAADKEMRWFVREYTEANQADRPITDVELLLIVGQAGTENARWHNLPEQFQFVLKDIYGEVLKADPDCWQAEYLAGRMLLEKHRRTEALAAFDKAIAINPKAVESHIGKGLVALQTYDLKEAERHAESALKLNPRHPEAIRLKADVLQIADDLAGAEKLLAVAKAVNPCDELTLARLAAIHHLTRRVEQFDAIVKEVEAFDAKPAAFYCELARCLEDRQRYEPAAEFYRKADELRPMVPGPRAALGLLLMRQGQEAEARSVLASAFKADPFDARLLNSIKVLEHLGTYQTIETPHFVLKFDPKTDRILAAFLAEYLEEVHADLKKRYGYEPPDKLLVEVFRTREMFSGRAVALPDLPDTVNGACTGPVIALPSPLAADGRPYNWGRVIRHELARAFTLLRSHYQAPRWLVDGLAMRNEGGRSVAGLIALREHLAAGTLYDLDSIGPGSVRPLVSLQSLLYVEYIVQSHGEAAIGKLLDAFRSGADTTMALKQALNVERAAFEAGYRQHVEAVVKAVGGPRPAQPVLTFPELEAAHQKDPDDADVAVKLAAEYVRRNRAADAKKLADAVLAKHKGHPGAAVVKARLLQRDKDDAGAKAVLEESHKAHPDDPRVLLTLGRLHLDAKDVKQAAMFFEAGRKVAPLDADWLTELARVYALLDRRDDLAAVFADIAAIEPDNVTVRLNLVRVLLKLDKPAEAERAARDALFIDLMNPDARGLLLDTLRAQKKDAEAEAIAKRFE